MGRGTRGTLASLRRDVTERKLAHRPGPGLARCSSAYSSERYLHPRDRQHCFCGAAELAFRTVRRAGLLGTGGCRFFFCPTPSLYSGCSALRAGEIGWWITLSELEKHPDARREWIVDFCCLPASGSCCSGHPPWLLSLWVFID